MARQIGKYDWVLSRGGPFVIMGLQKAKKWGGDIKNSSSCPLPPVGNDYTRAARFGAQEGIITDNDGEVLVYFAEGLCSKFFRRGKLLGFVNQELSGTYSEEIDFSVFDKFRIIKRLELFRIYFNENKIALFDGSINITNFEYDSMEIKVGWYNLVKIFTEVENVENFGKYSFYLFVECDESQM